MKAEKAPVPTPAKGKGVSTSRDTETTAAEPTAEETTVDAPEKPRPHWKTEDQLQAEKFAQVFGIGSSSQGALEGDGVDRDSNTLFPPLAYTPRQRSTPAFGTTPGEGDLSLQEILEQGLIDSLPSLARTPSALDDEIWAIERSSLRQKRRGTITAASKMNKSEADMLAKFAE